MKLFSSTQIAWNEPWFFLIRIRTLNGWLKRIGLGLLIAVITFSAMYFTGAGRFGLTESLSAGLLAGLVILLILDKGNIQREVTVKDDCIIVNSASGTAWFETFKFPYIRSVKIVRPNEWEYWVAGMLIDHGEDVFMVAIPPKVSLESLANILHRLEVAVTLSEWEPTETDARLQVKDDLEIDPSQAVGAIDVQPLEEGEPALLSPFHLGVQLVIALGPLLLVLIAGIFAGIHLYRNWSDLSILDKCLIGGGPLVGLVLAFLYLIRIGQFISAAYGVNVAQASMQRRPNAIFSGLEHDLVTVELFAREKWTAVAVMADDFGFLQIDRRQRLLRFEGNKHRWTLPFGALKTCRIEESIVGSEVNENSERRYYVVLSAEDGNNDWEYGLIYTRTETGSDTYEKRYDRSKLLFSQLVDAITV